MTLIFPTSSVVRAPHWGADARQPFAWIDFPVRYGLFVHPTEGVVLIDTGYTRDLFTAPGLALSGYRLLMRPKLDASQDPETVLTGMGATLADVRHIIITHLHADHVSGLGRFANATLHASRETLALWSDPPRISDAHTALFRTLLPALGGRAVRAVEDARVAHLPWGGGGHDIFGDGTVLTLDLPGHMRGHMGVVFPERDMPVLYAVDTAWTSAGYREAVTPPYPLRALIHDHVAYEGSCARVLAAEAWGARVVLCHDPAPLEAIA